jgi:hypothetical protein
MLEHCFPCVEFIEFEFKFICIQIVLFEWLEYRKRKMKGEEKEKKGATHFLLSARPTSFPSPSPLFLPHGPRPGPDPPAPRLSPLSSFPPQPSPSQLSPSRAQPPTARSPSFLSLAARSHRSAPFFPLSSFLPGAQRPEISGDLFTLGPHAKGTSPPFK